MTRILIPSHLDDWTYNSIKAIIDLGAPEDERYDFKYGLPDDATKICCAFANHDGGFIVVGVKDHGAKRFEIVGVESTKELYGQLQDKVNADAAISISRPKAITIPGSIKLLYVFEVPRSPRRPHLPTQAPKRIFWKRKGSSCVPMTLEEIRYQMNAYEEKREKLVLLVIDLHHKLSSLRNQDSLANGRYTGDVFSFEIIDRVVVESFALLKEQPRIFGELDEIRRCLMSVNTEKQKMLSVQTLDYSQAVKIGHINEFRRTVKNAIPELRTLTEQVERSLKNTFIS